MKAIRYLLISAIFFIVLSVSFNIYAFNSHFYKKEFEKYKVYDGVKNADELHKSVVDFIKGKSDVLPDDFNAREKSHLEDVRNVIKVSNYLFYFFVAVYIALLAFLSKKGKEWKREFANIMFYSGVFAVVFGALLFLSVSFGFGPFFELMHRTFFPQGNYSFDPAKEVIVRLYPEQLFMDMGVRIAMATFIMSLFLIISGHIARKK